MKSKLTNRLLMTIVVAVMLSVVFAVSSLAAITGGLGVIEGLESGKNYEAASVTMNAEGTGKAIDELNAFVLDANSNKDLAGLYVVRETDETEWSDIIYVYGDIENRKKLGTLTSDKPVFTNDTSVQWVPGVYVGARSWMATAFCAHDMYSSPYSPKELADAIATSDTEDETQMREKIRAVMQKISLNYAYTSDEIINIKEVKSMKFSSAYQNAYIKLVGAKPRVEFYIMLPDGTIDVVEWIGEGKDYTSKSTPNYTATLNLQTVDFQALSGLPKEGWLVGFKYYPIYDVELENMTPIDSTLNNKAIGIYMRAPSSLASHLNSDYYVINRPAMPTPTGITFVDGTFYGLQADKKYIVSPYTVLGIDEENAITVEGKTEFALDPEKQVGLWSIALAGNDDFAPSSPAVFDDKGTILIYNYPKLEVRKALYEFDSGKLITQRNTKDFVVGKITSNDNGLYPTATNIQTETGLGSDITIALFNAADAQARTQVLANNKDYIQGYTFAYGFMPEEILPVNDVRTYSYKVQTQAKRQTINFVYTNNTMRLDAYVMGLDGKVNVYTYLDTGKELATGSTTTSTIDFTSDEGWDKPLPDVGYLVGVKTYPMYGMTDGENVKFSFAGGNTTIHEKEMVRFNYYIGEYDIKGNAPAPKLSSFPVIAGGYGEISGLNPAYDYECQYSLDGGETWMDSLDENGQKKVITQKTAFKVTKGAMYRVRVMDSEEYYGSDYAIVTVEEYNEPDGEMLASEVVKIHLPNDFVELSASYEMDLSVKNWVSSLALENIKTVAPESIITLAGDGYKFVVTASNIVTDDKVHYYDMAVSLDGESRYNTLHDKLVEMAGKEYVTDVYFESSNGLPFEEAQLMILVDEDFEGADIELRAYNERIDKLRKVEEATVYNGWVTFNNFAETYVLISK